MFKRSLKDRIAKVLRILRTIAAISRRLEGRPNRRTGSQPNLTRPIDVPIERLWDFQDQVTSLKGQVTLGHGIPRARADLIMSYRRLLADVRLPSARPGSRTSVAKRHKALLRDLDEEITKLEAALQDIRKPRSEFERQLQNMIDKSGLSVYRLACMANIDPGYLWRLLNGERRNPGWDVVNALGKALYEASGEVTEKDLDRLLNSAGFASRHL